MNHRLYIWFAILTLAMAIPACGDDDDDAAQPEGKESAETSLRVAFVLDGPKDDGGWNQQHDIGREHLEENVPGVETTIVEGVSPGPQARTAFEDLIEEGYDVIVGTSYSYVSDIPATAEGTPTRSFSRWEPASRRILPSSVLQARTVDTSTGYWRER